MAEIACFLFARIIILFFHISLHIPLPNIMDAVRDDSNIIWTNNPPQLFAIAAFICNASGMHFSAL